MTAVLCTLAGASTASAVVPGGLLATSCLSSVAAAPCATVPQVGTPTDIAMSPDGANVYVTTSVPSLVTYSRNPATGQLSLQQCYRTTATGGCQALPITAAWSLSAPTAVAVTPDGANVYVASSGNSAIHEFNRAADGSLSLKPGSSACIANSGGGVFPCDDAEAMLGTADLAVAGSFLYVASSNATSGGVTALTIGPGGVLSQPSDAGGGLRACATGNTVGVEGCTFSRGLGGAHSLVVTATKVYAATTAGRIVTINRDPGSGQLIGATTPAGCLTGSATTGCAPVGELAAGVTSLALGAEGQVYAAVAQSTTPEGVVSQSGRVLTFDGSGEGLARRPGAAGCVSNGAAANCTTGRGLGTNASSQVITTPDGVDVYATGSGVVELDRGANLTPRGDARGCVHPTALANCSTHAQLGTLTGLAAAPDGRHVYAIGSGGRITTLRRDSSGPVCQNVATTVQHGSVQTLAIPCSDPDGDPLTFTPVNPPTLGALGAIDHSAATAIYAAPQGQNGSTTISFRALYSSFGTFEADGSIQVHVTGAPNVVPAGVDADADGFMAGQDCNDNNRNIRPGSTEIKGNIIDENCDGVAEPFPTLASGVLHNWSYTKRGTTFTLKTLKITQQFPKGWTVTIRCSGKKCPFKAKTLKAGKVKKAASSVIASLTKKQRRFRAGQTVEIWVSAPNFNTKVARITLKRGKQPAIVPYCVLPGSSKVQKTCT